jgi:GT2 family glycosyltransferase
MQDNFLSIVIINYNTFSLTCQCVESIVKYTKGIRYEIIIVDNNSTEMPADKFLEVFPFIKLVKNSSNSGFASGNNLGILNSSGELILLLNSDTYLLEDSLSLTANKLLQNPSIGVIGCGMIYPDGVLQNSARRFRSIKWEMLDLFRPVLYMLKYKTRANLMLGKYFKSDFDTECDWLNGAFFMFRKELLTQLENKKLDERFFMYGEDHLWCWQIKQLGYKNFFFSTTKIVHINNASTSYEKRIKLLSIIYNHELEIMKERKGNGLYFFAFKCIYTLKEQTRILIKRIMFKLSGSF